jgi:hypothetical protein
VRSQTRDPGAMPRCAEPEARPALRGSFRLEYTNPTHRGVCKSVGVSGPSMNFLPLVAHEMRAAVRRPVAYRVRLAAGGAAMGLSCWGLLIWADTMGAARLGHSLLEAFGWAGFVGSALAGLFLTSDCISQERREGTLGLLFLTDLRGYDVAFGKLAAKGILPFYCLLAIFPPLTVCMVVGGVTAGEVWRLSLVLLNTLFFSLSVTILTSTFCRQQRAAQAGALLAILLTVPGPALFGAALNSSASSSFWRSCSLLSPAGSYLRAFDGHYRAVAGWFWGSLLATHLFAWACLLLAGRLLPQISLEEAILVGPRSKGGGARRASRSAARRQETRRDWLSQNPIAWLASRDEWAQRLIWCLPALALWIGFSFAADPLGGTSAQISFFALIGVHALFKIRVGVDASHEFAASRLNGTLELLLSTPLQTREVAAGMLSAYRGRFIGPLLALMLVDALLAAKLHFMNNTPGALIASACAAMLLVDCYCLCWVGLWRGLVARDPVRAIVATLWRVLVLPWILLAFGVSIFHQSTLPEYAGLWAFLGGVINVVLVVNAKDFFAEHFRTMALRPFGAKPPRVESKWSPMNWEEEGESGA